MRAAQHGQPLLIVAKLQRPVRVGEVDDLRGFGARPVSSYDAPARLADPRASARQVVLSRAEACPRHPAQTGAGAARRRAPRLQEPAPGQALVQRQEARSGAAAPAVRHQRRKLGVQVRAEPVRRPQRVQQLLRGRAAQRVCRDFSGQEALSAAQAGGVAKGRDPARPVVREEGVERAAQLA